jgi:hypothetical protein
MPKTHRNTVRGLFGRFNIFKRTKPGTTPLSENKTLVENLVPHDRQTFEDTEGNIEDSRKHLTIEEIITSINFVKEIDGITFCAISMVLGYDVEHVDEKEHLTYYYRPDDKVRLVSIDKNKTKRYFWAYQSHSEVGMWRWCSGTQIPPTNVYVYDKFSRIPYGNIESGDYVQTTLLHIELQLYLNEIINSQQHRNQLLSITRSLKDDRDEPLDGLVRLPVGTTCNNLKALVKDKRERFLIYPYSREIQTPPFDMFNKNQQCADQIDVTVLQRFSNQFENDYEVVDTNTIHENYKYENKKPYLRSGQISEIKVVGDLKEIILRRKIQSTSKDGKLVNLIKLLYLETKEIILNAKYWFLTTNQTRRQPWRGPEIIVSKDGMPMRGRIYHMPFALIPIIDGVAECNPYGLYSKYIKAGAYICKLFEYVEQCIPEVSRRRKCLERYVFIGDRYNNLFPFTLNPLPLKSLNQPFSPSATDQTKSPLFTDYEPVTEGLGIANKKSRRRRCRNSRMSRKRR